VVYTDGLTPAQISQRIRAVKKTVQLLEDDLEKQDKQTDKETIAVEMALYEWLGCSKQVMSAWKTVHGQWRFKANMSKGWRSAMRTTGQATTALGNVVTNMQVHADFVIENYEVLELILLLGDDNLMFSTRRMSEAEITKLSKDIRTKHNMLSKLHLHDEHGTFCQMIVGKTQQGWQLGPDWVRMRYRFEVYNGVGELTPEKRDARKLSYLMMMGKDNQTDEIKEMLNAEELPTSVWYDHESLITSLKSKYEMTTEEVLNNRNILLKYMKEEPKMLNFKMWTSIWKKRNLRS